MWWTIDVPAIRSIRYDDLQSAHLLQGRVGCSAIEVAHQVDELGSNTEILHEAGAAEEPPISDFRESAACPKCGTLVSIPVNATSMPDHQTRRRGDSCPPAFALVLTPGAR